MKKRTRRGRAKAKAAAKSSLEAKRAHKAMRRAKKSPDARTGQNRKPYDDGLHPRDAKGRFAEKPDSDGRSTTRSRNGWGATSAG